MRATRKGSVLLPLFMALANPVALQANEHAIRAHEPDEQFVADYMRLRQTGTFFVLNKKRGELNLIENSAIIASFRALSGQKKGDQNIKYVTPAGIFPLVPATDPDDPEKSALKFSPERTDTKNHVATIHPVLDVKGQNRRARLESETPDDNRISDGCININDADYNKIMRFVKEYSAYFNGTPLYIVVLPEEQNVASFPWPQFLPAVWQIFPR